jgi:hypothetical protein
MNNIVAMRKVTDLNKYKTNKGRQSNSTLSLFETRTINVGVIKVYVCEGKFALIKFNNSRIYRIGPSLESILIHNIPKEWQCIAVYKGLTLGNLAELWAILFKKKKVK